MTRSQSRHLGHTALIDATNQASQTEGGVKKRPAAIHRATHSLYFDLSYNDCSDSVKESRDNALRSLVELLGDDFDSWFAPGSRPDNLSKNPRDWSNTILNLLLELAQLARKNFSEDDRLASIHECMRGRSLNDALIHMHRDDAVKIERKAGEGRYKAKVAGLRKWYSDEKQKLKKQIADVEKDKRDIQRQHGHEQRRYTAQISELRREQDELIRSKDAQIKQLLQQRGQLEAHFQERYANVETIVKMEMASQIDEELKRRLAVIEARETTEALNGSTQ